MNLFDFICHFDPIKVQIGERNLADCEVKLLKMTEGHTILLNPPVTTASGDSGDSIDKMFDEGNDANQEHSVGVDDVLEEVVALDASEVDAEKAKKKQKRKMIEGVSGSVYPPKKLRDDHQSLPHPTGGKSLFALHEMVLEDFAIPNDATEPLVTVFVTPMSDVGLWILCSYSETASLVRSAVDVSVVTVFVTITVDANVATGSKSKDTPKYFEHIEDFASSLDTKIMHRVYVLRWKMCAMDFDRLYSEFNVRAARQVCLWAEVRIRAENTLERKIELKDRCAEQTTLLSEKDVKIAHLRSFLSLKEVEAAEAISLRSQLSVVEAMDAAKGNELKDLKEKNFALEGEKNVLSERVKALESVAASKEVELASFSSQVVNLTTDLSGLQLSRHELNSKMHDEQVCVLSDRFVAIDSYLMEMVLHMDAEFYPRYLTTIAGRRWILSRGLRLVLAKCLSSPEYLSAMGEAIGCAIDKGMQDGLAAGIEHGIAERSIMDVAAFNPSAESDYIVAINALQGVSPAAETSEASQLQPSLDQLMIPIHRLEDQLLAACLLWIPLVEPLSARNLTVHTALSTVVPPSPKVVFEEEESLLAFVFSVEVIIGGGGLNFPLSKARISFGVFLIRVNLSCLRSVLCWFQKLPFLKFYFCPASCCFHNGNDFFHSQLEAATSPLRNAVVTLIISSTDLWMLSCSLLISSRLERSSSTLDFCLFGLDFQCPLALPSLSDSAFVFLFLRLLLDDRCFESLEYADTLFPLSPSLWNTPFSSLLNTVFLSESLSFSDLEWSRLRSGLPDLLRRIPHDGRGLAKGSLLVSAHDAGYLSYTYEATDFNPSPDYDYIIVGGGTAGCPLAATLSEQYSVLLLERGGVAHSDPNILYEKNSLTNIINAKNENSHAQAFTSKDGIQNARGNVLGGSSMINFGFYSRADDYFYNKSRIEWDMKNVEKSYEWVEDSVVSIPECLNTWQNSTLHALLESEIGPANGFTVEHLLGTKVSGSTFDGSGRRHGAVELLNKAHPEKLRVVVHATVDRIIFSHSKLFGKLYALRLIKIYVRINLTTL
nr:(R)-mandelonitrile lyase-like [Tanacetum cinerariifolium]